MLKKVLIANRGEIACRIARTCRKLGLEVATVHSSADRFARHVREIGESVELGGAAPSESYLNIDAIIAAARRVGADAVHPGYGFVSENPAFVRALDAAGLTFIGPRADTIERFSRAFAEVGFRREAFFPCYGLAEATLFVSGGPWGQGPTVLDVSRASLEQKRVTPATAGDRLRLVSSGAPATVQHVRVVDPESRMACDSRRIGEIWVRGESVASGYWNNEDESRATFGATIAGEPERAWLRTGDLGFLDDGQLFVTGRLKDLIIIGGRNYYPQDLELAAERCAGGNSS